MAREKAEELHDEIWKARACEHGTPEWKEAQAEALRKHGYMVSKCHPFVPVTKDRDGNILCGYFGDYNNPICRNVVRKARSEPNELDLASQAEV